MIVHHIRRMSHRGWVDIEEAHQDLADNARADRSVAVQAFKVQLRRSRIPEPCRVDVRLESRAICRDVMRDELAKERPAGRFRSQRRLIVLFVAAVAEPAGPAKGVQECFVCRERRKIGKQSGVRA